ncbi:MAG: hypothetical protein N2037_11130 [Acidimicrobiales bacterium]|nr:hypothetical protein [Acidimicrobiales bacterium]
MTLSRPISVVIADPNELRRNAMAAALTAASGSSEVHGTPVAVIGHAGVDEDAINIVLELAPDVALVSVDDVAAFDGRAVCLVCSERMGVTRLVAVAETETPALYATLRSGAFSTYLRSAPVLPLARTLWGAQRGESVLSPGAAAWLIAEIEHLVNGDDDLETVPPMLSELERSVLQALADGATPQDVANDLLITVHMVNTLAGHGLAKLHRTLRDDRELKLARQS